MRWIAAFIVCVAFVLVPLAAQQPPAATDGFVPLSEFADREILPATPLVFYAYGFVWVALMAYVWMIWRRMGKVEQDLESVRKRLTDRGAR
jgi:CcmD family protein